jgi:hypothetical protein
MDVAAPVDVPAPLGVAPLSLNPHYDTYQSGHPAGGCGSAYLVCSTMRLLSLGSVI